MPKSQDDVDNFGSKLHSKHGASIRVEPTLCQRDALGFPSCVATERGRGATVRGIEPLSDARLALLLSLALCCASVNAQSTDRPRIRDLGISPGIFAPGALNAITDVAGVRVGHQTLVRDDSVRTGVTAILPHGGNLFQEKVPAGMHAANAFGKAAGLLQIEELGLIESPIVLTNTLAVGTAIEGTVAYTLDQPGNERIQSVNAVVGETNDGYLNDIRGRHVTVEDVRAAIDSASTGPVAEGNVGAGTGTVCFGWKGGIGTSSRVLPASLGGYTVGVLVQSNYDGVLVIDGVRVGEHLGQYTYRDDVAGGIAQKAHPEQGSVMIVIATDAPVDARTLERMARRAPLGLARTGSFMSNGSGDFAIAFSTQNRVPYSPTSRTQPAEYLHNDSVSPLFLAVVEAVEEAVYNSLTRAESMTGHLGHRVEAFDVEALRALLGKRGN